MYSRSYTIINATFDDDGEYQCRRNGRNVFPSPLEVEVYGKCDVSMVSAFVNGCVQWSLCVRPPVQSDYFDSILCQ